MAYNSLAGRALGAGLVQPDQRTCGSCVLVMARMVNDAAYAGLVVEGEDPVTGERMPGTLQERFRQQAFATHRLTSGIRDSGGGWQVPWPMALGTQPWALASEMTSRAGRRGTSYVVRAIRPSGRSSEFRRVAALVADGHAVPLYVGNTWTPRHVVLALPVDEPLPDTVVIYDPANGRRYPITAADFAAGSLQVGGWRVPWVSVVPRTA